MDSGAERGVTRPVRWAFSDRFDGDFAIGRAPEERDRQRRRLVDHPWAYLRQTHSATVLTVGPESAPENASDEGDGLITFAAGQAVSVQTADCCPILIWATDGADGVAAVHAGWKGLELGILAEAVAGLRSGGADGLRARLGPCICPGCYEFGPDLIETFRQRFGASAASTTWDGRPSLDVRSVVATQLERAGVELVGPSPVCTRCADRHFSYRRDATKARQTSVVLIEDSSA